MSLEFGNKEQKYLAKKYKANGNRYRGYLFGGPYMDVDKKRFIDITRGKHSKKMKRHFNHVFRQQMRNIKEEDSPNYKKGNPQKKQTDYWNTMY